MQGSTQNITCHFINSGVGSDATAVKKRRHWNQLWTLSWRYREPSKGGYDYLDSFKVIKLLFTSPQTYIKLLGQLLETVCWCFTVSLWSVVVEKRRETSTPPKPLTNTAGGTGKQGPSWQIQPSVPKWSLPGMQPCPFPTNTASALHRHGWAAATKTVWVHQG